MRPRLIALVLGLAIGAAACTGAHPRQVTYGPQGGGTVSLPASPDALPQFDVASFRQLLTQLHGKPVVVNFWASWCGPCVVEAPALATLARETRGKAQFIGVDILDQRTPARAHVHQYGWTFPSVFDPKGSIRDGLGFVGQPITVVYDSTGKQIWLRSGPITESLLRAQLHKLRVV